jgi:hypothetical protein
MEGYFDEVSANLEQEVSRNSVAKLLINMQDVKIAQGYVTAKVENRYGDMVNINIQPGRPGILLHETIVNFKGKAASMVYILTTAKDGNRIVRKMPFNGFSDWVLIFDDILFMETVKGGCEEMEVFVC